jgi:hypothetical protein
VLDLVMANRLGVLDMLAKQCQIRFLDLFLHVWTGYRCAWTEGVARGSGLGQLEEAKVRTHDHAGIRRVALDRSCGLASRHRSAPQYSSAAWSRRAEAPGVPVGMLLRMIRASPARWILIRYRFSTDAV